MLASENWHGGVIGIVASRLVDKFARPTILVAFNGDGGQGSGRSIPGFNLVEALDACSKHLRSYGGHAMAGGLRRYLAKDGTPLHPVDLGGDLVDGQFVVVG